MAVQIKTDVTVLADEAVDRSKMPPFMVFTGA